MIDDHPDLERKYRSPRVFGPLPGPRNLPLSHRHVAGLPDEVTTSLSVSLEAAPIELARLLPPDTRLADEAAITVTATRFENLRWLAGRGYPILSVTIPVEYVGYAGDDAVQAAFLAVLWEGLADPITTGREELGFPKLFADIRAPEIDGARDTGSIDVYASWDGFRFFDMEAEGLRDVPSADAAVRAGTIVHRFLPSLGAPDRADVDQLIFYPPPPAGAKASIVTDRLAGTGRFDFHHAQFADVPVQFPVINALARLSTSASGPATLTRSTSEPRAVTAASTPRRLSGTVAGRTPQDVSR